MIRCTGGGSHRIVYVWVGSAPTASLSLTADSAAAYAAGVHKQHMTRAVQQGQHKAAAGIINHMITGVRQLFQAPTSTSASVELLERMAYTPVLSRLTCAGGVWP